MSLLALVSPLAYSDGSLSYVVDCVRSADRSRSFKCKEKTCVLEKEKTQVCEQVCEREIPSFVFTLPNIDGLNSMLHIIIACAWM